MFLDCHIKPGIVLPRIMQGWFAAAKAPDIALFKHLEPGVTTFYASRLRVLCLFFVGIYHVVNIQKTIGNGHL